MAAPPQTASLPECRLEVSRRERKRYGSQSSAACIDVAAGDAATGQTDGVDGEQKQPAKQQPPDKEEIRSWVRELNAGLTSNDKRTVEEAARLCRRSRNDGGR
jgi:hypothetical protein